MEPLLVVLVVAVAVPLVLHLLLVRLPRRLGGLPPEPPCPADRRPTVVVLLCADPAADRAVLAACRERWCDIRAVDVSGNGAALERLDLPPGVYLTRLNCGRGDTAAVLADLIDGASDHEHTVLVTTEPHARRRRDRWPSPTIGVEIAVAAQTGCDVVPLQVRLDRHRPPVVDADDLDLLDEALQRAGSTR